MTIVMMTEVPGADADHNIPGGRFDIDFPTETHRRLEVVHGGTAAATAVGH